MLEIIRINCCYPLAKGLSMLSIRDSLGSFDALLADSFAKSLGAKILCSVQETALAGRSATEPVVQRDSLQAPLRKVYGKGNPLPIAYGDHPDFEHLRGTNQTEHCAITTLFMDIESSTRYGLLYPPEDVLRIKNAFLCCATEIVRAFDGHVHRFMGDAVMAFFGGKDVRPEVGAVDAINAAAFLAYYVDKAVIPQLGAHGYHDPFGVRIGVDHGSEEHVVWGPCGYPGIEEVTATSFYVDIASKLQHAAARNQIMIGQSLRRLVDFPHELLETKTVQHNGSQQLRPYVLPNHTDRAGNPVNYGQFVLNGADYLSLSPFAADIYGTPPSSPDGPLTVPVYANWAEQKHGMVVAPVVSCGTVLPKDRGIRFTIGLPAPPDLPYRVRCAVENHGEQAKELGGDDHGNHDTVHDVRTEREHRDFRHWESAAYRGLHYLLVDISCRGRTTHQGRFGVFIE